MILLLRCWRKWTFGVWRLCERLIMTLSRYINGDTVWLDRASMNVMNIKRVWRRWKVWLIKNNWPVCSKWFVYWFIYRISYITSLAKCRQFDKAIPFVQQHHQYRFSRVSQERVFEQTIGEWIRRNVMCRSLCAIDACVFSTNGGLSFVERDGYVYIKWLMCRKER